MAQFANASTARLRAFAGRILLAVAAASWNLPDGRGMGAPGVRDTVEERLQHRWLFVWRNMSDPREIERMISRFPQAAALGYNGVVFSHNVAESKAAELKEGARRNGLSLIVVVMDGVRDRNYAEGVPVENALFMVRAGRATLEQDSPTPVNNGDFEQANGDKFAGWTFQDDVGLTTFADHEVTHGGKTSLRMENVDRNEAHHCRVSQPIKLQPHRQYAVSFWVKTEGLKPADAEVKILAPDAKASISFQTFKTSATQDWKRYDLVFNSMEYSEGRLYVGSWSGGKGKLWWDDLVVREIGLVNVLRRPGCPVAVRGEEGMLFEEGRDFERIEDPLLNPWRSFHEEPVIKLTGSSRIQEGSKLRVSYYHPLVVYDDRVTSCLSEPKIFELWRADVRRANELLHPAGFLMSHDELRVMNQCALCRSKGMTPGELLAWNVHLASGIIREIRPDAQIWVWNDMFDPMHNAVDHYYAVNGSLAGSWKGLDPDVGIANWHGGLKGRNCKFFADLGLKQILCGYYDADEEGNGIAEWLEKTKEIPGIVGAMYTTWEDKYGAMQKWAARAWGEQGKK